MSKKILKIKNLKVSRNEQEIVHGISFEIPAGTIQVLMGPNGSGKSSLANALMGHPDYTITDGSVLLDSVDITSLTPDRRAKLGLLLSLQSPPEIPGVPLAEFLRLAYNAVHDQDIDSIDFRQMLEVQLKRFSLPASFADRGVNEGFSGGERKKAEMLQLAVLSPKYAVLDETDSGLDVDALKLVAEGVGALQSEGTGLLLITHHTRILNYLKPNRVLVMKDGLIVRNGGPELALEIEEKGFSNI